MFQFYHRPGDPTNRHQTDSNHGRLFYEHSWCHKFSNKIPNFMLASDHRALSCWEKFQKKNSPNQPTNNCCSSVFCNKKNLVSSFYFILKIMITRLRGTRPARAVKGWWRPRLSDVLMVAADNGRSYFWVWSPGLARVWLLRPVWNYELRDTGSTPR